MPSKQVNILRRPKLTKLRDQELYNESSRKIGAQLVPGTNGAVLRGLTPDEEEKWLPEIIDVGVNEPGFRKAKEEFWNDFTLAVPLVGVTLEIGTTESGEPIKLDDYVTWRWLLKHGEVANTKDEMEMQDHYLYYIDDPVAKEQHEINAAEKRRKAQRVFLKLEDDLTKQGMILRVLGVDTRYVPEALFPVKLEEKMLENTDAFMAVIADKSLETKSLVEELLAFGILNKQVSAHYYDDLLLGNNLADTIKYLDNPAHSKLVTTLKAMLEQGRKNLK